MAIQTYTEKINGLRSTLHANEEKITKSLPSHISFDRIHSSIMLAINKTPKLLECSKASFMQAVMDAASLGLEVGGSLGMAYFIPYGNTCQLIVGYKGILNLAHRSGFISTFEAHAVYEQDEFECELGLNPVLRHVPSNDADRGAMVCVYAIAVMKDGRKQFTKMSKAEVDAIRARSMSGKNGPWVTDYPRMAVKSVLKNLSTQLPLSPDLQRAFELDNEFEMGVQTMRDVNQEFEVPSQVDSLKDDLGITDADKEATDIKKQEAIASLTDNDPAWDPDGPIT